MSDVHVCGDCGKEYKSRSGLWKHQQKCTVETPPSPKPSEVVETVESPHLRDDPSPQVEPTTSDTTTSETTWSDFDMGIGDETEVIPAPLKMLTTQDFKTGRKMTAKELKQLAATEKAILKAGLTFTDGVLSRYGKAVTLDSDFEVIHSEAAKDMVAGAQQEWLDEKGIHFTHYLGKGAVAGLLTTWYVGAPLVRIKREAKKPMLKKLGGGAGALLGRLPLIGRLFKKKKFNNEFEIPEDIVEVETFE